MDGWATPPKRVTSPTWGPPPPCKQALSPTKQRCSCAKYITAKKDKKRAARENLFFANQKKKCAARAICFFANSDLLNLMPFSLPSPFSITLFNFFLFISIIDHPELRFQPWLNPDIIVMTWCSRTPNCVVYNLTETLGGKPVIL